MAGLQIVIVFTASVVLVSGSHLRRMLATLRGRPAIALLCYYVFAAVSALWSPHAAYSLYMAGEALVLSVLTLTVMSQVRNAAKGERVFLSVVAVLMMILYIPRAMAQGSILVHTNQYSICALLLFCYAIAEYGNALGARRRWLLVFGGIGLFGLVAGTCTGSNIAAVAGVLSLCLVRPDLRWRVVFTVIGLAVLLFLAGLDIQDVGDVLAPGKGWDGVSRGQNRMSVWEPLIEGIKERPVLGFGFGVGSKVYSVKASGAYLQSAHNLLLEVFLSTGAIGVGVFLIGTVQLLYISYRMARQTWPGTAGVFAAIVGVLVNSLSGAPVYASVWAPVAFAFFVTYGFFEFNVCGMAGKMEADSFIHGSPDSYIGNSGLQHASPRQQNAL